MKQYPEASLEEKTGFDVLPAFLQEALMSALGQDALAAMQPASTLQTVVAELTRVDELVQAVRFDDPVPFHDLLDIRSVLRQAAPQDALVPPDALLAVLRVQRTARLLRTYFVNRTEKYPELQRFAARLTSTQDLEKHLSSLVDDEGRIKDGASPELRRIRRALVQQRNALRNSVMRALRDATGRGYATEEQPTLRNGRMVIPVRAEAKRKIKGFVHDASSTGQTVYIEPAASLELNNEVRELELEEHREIERILRAATGHIRSKRAALDANLNVLGQFDLLYAKARLARSLDAHVPEVVAEPVVVLKAARNPALQLHFLERNPTAARAVVPLQLDLGGEQPCLLITGPNAGGKTVAMKTVALSVLMVAYGMPIPADPTSRIGLFSHLIVDIGDEQSMEDDLSTFSSHVTNLKYMLAHADAHSLVLMDEAGTGTDPAEGGALAQAILEELAARNVCTMATTHHGTLKVFAHEHPKVANGSMAFDQATLSPTYRFRPGIPGSSYAFEIAERIGLDAALLERSRALVGNQKTALEDLIVSFERRNETLVRQLAESQIALKKAEHTRRSFEGRNQKLQNEADRIRSQALDEAARIVQEANAQVERTIREIKEAAAEKEATKLARETLSAFKETVEESQTALSRKKARRARKERRRESGRGDRTAEGTPPNRVAGSIRVGDQVVLDDGSTSAEVLELDRKEAVIAAGQMKMRVKLKRLRKVGGPKRQQVVVRQVQTADATSLKRVEQRLDLRGQRADEAVAAVQRLVDQALSANLNELEIVHGKGTGALRQAIQSYLATRKDISHYEDAPWDQGGPGVTHVFLA